jgi:ABC-type polysaccharide/polyol phosphate transport system ATPase subunit
MDSAPSPVVISLSGVSVQYRVPTEQIGTLKEYVIRMMQGRRVDYRSFWALNGLDLEVGQGETLGIIGRNGAGKSTLLKVIARVLRPTKGRVRVRGSIAPLIELGAGFHPELTGRENVYLNGAMLGFSQEQMKERYERIVEFAELGPFIDAAMRSYSSGMVMRLGFAVATEVHPDILIIDEVLAVGDEAFQEKCRSRMSEFRSKGTTILYVSHALEAVRNICDRAVWIEAGQLRASGPAGAVIDAYRSFIAPGAHDAGSGTPT